MGLQPLVQGSYDRDDRPFPDAYEHAGTTERLAGLTRRADELGVPRSRLVLAWMLDQGWKPIVGVSTVEQLDSALASDSLRPRSAEGRSAAGRSAGTAAHVRRRWSMTQTPGLTAADRLLHQRIIVLGREVDDPIANRICAELLLLSAEDRTATSASTSTLPAAR